MKSKHTDGKWELRGNRLFVKDTYKSIAIIEVQNNFDIQKFKTIEDTEQIANAKLIAAAPDLLEALTECLSDLHYQIESKHGAKAASEYHSIVKAKNIIDKIKK